MKDGSLKGIHNTRGKRFLLVDARTIDSIEDPSLDNLKDLIKRFVEKDLDPKIKRIVFVKVNTVVNIKRKRVEFGAISHD